MVGRTMAVMKHLGYTRVIVVHGKDVDGSDAIDEISPAGETVAAELLESGEVSRYPLYPEDFGITAFPLSKVQALKDIGKEVERFLSVIAGDGPRFCEDFVCMNAGAILYCRGTVRTYLDGAVYARELIRTGAASDKLQEWIAVQG